MYPILMYPIHHVVAVYILSRWNSSIAFYCVLWCTQEVSLYVGTMCVFVSTARHVCMYLCMYDADRWSRLVLDWTRVFSDCSWSYIYNIYTALQCFDMFPNNGLVCRVSLLFVMQDVCASARHSGFHHHQLLFMQRMRTFKSAFFFASTGVFRY